MCYLFRYSDDSTKRFICPFRLDPDEIDSIRYIINPKPAIGYKFYQLARTPTRICYIFFFINKS